jgi:NAD(P)H-dependent FMN reductase
MSNPFRLAVVICSTRPGRLGAPVANWVFGHAKSHASFTSELVDLAEMSLPVFDEPHHPRLKKYTHEHTKKWSALVESFDAFVFVTPEYDFSMPASLLNALQFLFSEWQHKACAFVSYGGVSGGLRGVQMSKQVTTALSMMPLSEAVALPFFTKQIADGVFKPEESQNTSCVTMLNALAKWTTTMKPLRAA